MPGKLIAFIAILVIIVTFIGFNYNNSSDITIWPERVVFEEVPIFVSFFIMYLIGVVSVIPFIVGWKIKGLRKKDSGNTEAEDADIPAKKKKTRVLGRRKKATEPPSDEIQIDAEENSGEIPHEGESEE